MKKTPAIVLLSPADQTTDTRSPTVIGGLTFAERCILALAQQGIRRFFLLSHSPTTLVQTLQNTKKLSHLDITPIDSLDNIGPGPYYVTRDDFVLEKVGYQNLFAQSTKQPEQNLHIAQDDKSFLLAYVHDVQDLERGDTEQDFLVQDSHPVTLAPSTLLEQVAPQTKLPKLEKALCQTLRKPTDGWVSKHINRAISLPSSRVLASLGIHPNIITTTVFIVSMYGAYLAMHPDYLHVMIGGLLFQTCSIFDGCDGEVSRLRLQSSLFGAWYDTITDNIRYAAFIIALAYSGFALSGSNLYLWAVVYFAVLLVFLITIMVRYERKVNAGTHLVITNKIESEISQMSAFWRLGIMPLRGLIKQDVSALVVMIFCLLGIGHHFIWAATVVLTFMTIIVSRSLLGR